MNSRFKFPRRVRIHGWECGAVARALHHEAQKDALMSYEQTLVTTEKAVLRQADSGKALGSTLFERKQMSTKTTLKRIALVAVSALGLGLLSVVPAKATSGSMSVSTTSLTVVGTGTTGNTGLFYVDVFDDGAAGAAAGLVSGESISVTVTGKPTYLNDGSTAAAFANVTIQPVTTSAGASFSTCGLSSTASAQVPNGAGSCVSNDWAASDDATTGTSARYWFAAYPTSTSVVDAGEYTLTVRLNLSSTTVGATSTLKVKWVSLAADSGAAITIAQTGALRSGAAASYTSTNNVKVTLKDGNGGRLVTGQTAATGLSSRVPALTLDLLDSSGVVVAESGDSLDDNGTAAQDHVAPTTYATYAAYRALGDGVYGYNDATVSGTSSTVSSLRVRYGTASTTSALTILGATTADETKMDLTLTADGIKAGEELLKSNVDTTQAYYLPLTTKSGSLKINIDGQSTSDLANLQMRVKRTWSGNYASAAVTPVSQTAATTETTDASGNITIPFTNTSPLDGAILTITVTGFDTTLTGAVNGSRTITLNWAKSSVDSVTILDPVSGVRVKAGSTNVFTVIVKDQFGTAMSGEQVQPAITGTSDNNYSSTTTYATITTGANGTATWSLTDAAAVAGTDTVKFTTINNAKTASLTLTYVTTLPVVATLRAFFNRDESVASSAASTWTLVPSTGIYQTDGGSAYLTVTPGRNYSRAITAGSTTTDDLIKYRIEALTSAGASATGAAVTVTAGTGGYVLGADNVPTTSRTIPVSGGYIYFVGGATGTGAVTFTITAGTVSTSASQWMKNATGDARFVKIAADATTGKANGSAIPMTVTVTDRFGNPVEGVSLTMTASGVGSFSGGATTQSYQTDSAGKYTFLATSLVDAGGVGTFTATATNATESASSAGYVLTTAVDSTLAAGNKAASASVTFAAGVNAAQAAAEAANDAAAEAIDAANAATDAANLAAEAADAATVAAEEARDAADAATAAVEELATQVATLMAALKAQITTLANTVAKIAKKVKA